jgi:hypothetical protein
MPGRDWRVPARVTAGELLLSAGHDLRRARLAGDPPAQLREVVDIMRTLGQVTVVLDRYLADIDPFRAAAPRLVRPGSGWPLAALQAREWLGETAKNLKYDGRLHPIAAVMYSFDITAWSSAGRNRWSTGAPSVRSHTSTSVSTSILVRGAMPSRAARTDRSLTISSDPLAGRTIRPPRPSAGRGRSSALPGCGLLRLPRPGPAEPSCARPPRR